MTTIHPVQLSMLSGELSEYTDPRQDVSKVKEGLSRLRNMIPLPFGGVASRAGTEFIFESGGTVNGVTTGKSKLIPFIFTPTETYMLEFSKFMIRFFRNGKFVAATEPFTDLTLTEFINKSNGTGVFGFDAVNNRDTLQGGGVGNEAIAERGYLLSPGTYTFTCNASNSVVFRAGTTSGGTDIKSDTTLSAGSNTVTFTVPVPTSTIYMQFENSNNDSRWIDTISWTKVPPAAIATPYDESDIPNIRVAQSNDILYIVDGKHRVQSLKAVAQTSGATFELSTVTIIDGPYGPENLSSDTITPSTSGIGVYTLTASTGLFSDSNAIGQSIRLKHNNKWGAAEIIEWISTTQVKVQDFSGTHPYQGTTATSAFRFGEFSDSSTMLWPDNVTLHEGRLVFSKGNKVYFSMSGQFNASQVRLDPSQTDGTVADDNGFTVSLDSTEINNVQWFSPGDKLVLGTDGAEWVIKAGDTSKAISPANKTARRQSKEGSKVGADSIYTGGITLFVSRRGKKVWRIGFSFEKDSYVADDVTIFSDHITDPGITTIANQSEPYNIVWAVLSDGDLATLTFSESQKVNGWARHSLTNGVVEDIASLPSETGDDDELWMIVKRTINGNEVRYIERLSKFNIRPTLADNKQLDCHLEYNGVATSVLAGLDHLEGETVQVLSDGKRLPDATVSGGSITLDRDVTNAVVGYKYDLELDTVILQDTLPTGLTLAGKQTRLVAVDIRLGYSVGIAYVDPKTQDEYLINANVFEDPTIVQDQWVKIIGGAGWSDQTKIKLRLREPYFLSILTIAPRYEVSDRRQS